MRVNLENNLTRGQINHQSRYSRTVLTLIGNYVIPMEATVVQFLNPGAANRTVFLPAYRPAAESGLYWVINTSETYNLSVVDSNGVAIALVPAGSARVFIENVATWSVDGLSGDGTEGMQIVTAAGTTTVLPGTTLLIFNKSVASVSPCNLPTVASRDRLVLEIYDFTGLAGDITLTPAGSDKIMGDTTPWTISSGGIAQSGGKAKLTPIATVGWMVL